MENRNRSAYVTMTFETSKRPYNGSSLDPFFFLAFQASDEGYRVQVAHADHSSSSETCHLEA